MDENKEFGMEPDVFQPEPQRKESPAFEKVPGYVQEEPPVTRRMLRGSMVTAREEYANFDPMKLPRYAEDPYRPQYQPPAPVSEPGPEKEERKKEQRKGSFFKKCLTSVAVLALVISGCAVTAGLVNSKWEKQVNALEASFALELDALQQQVDTLKPSTTGISVSGTVGTGDALTASQVYAQNVQSVVLIEATVTAEYFGQTSTGVSSGSGFILTEDGYVVTNAHVVEGAVSVNVVLYDGASYPASLVGQDSPNDLAVLKVEASGLNAAELGSSDNLIVGDQVVAIGNPLGELTSTLTVGYVSAKERTVDTDGTVITMIQTDAAINSGNSGGPLFNMKGQVVGITTAKYSGSSSSGASIEGIGFAIPISDVREYIQDLIEYGYIKSAYLGVMVQSMDPTVAGIYSLPVGAYVASVEDGYCAKRAGIKAKDIIVAVGDEAIDDLSDLTRALRKYEPGDKVIITVYRAGQLLEIQVTLDERPASAG